MYLKIDKSWILRPVRHVILAVKKAQNARLFVQTNVLIIKCRHCEKQLGHIICEHGVRGQYRNFKGRMIIKKIEGKVAVCRRNCRYKKNMRKKSV